MKQKKYELSKDETIEHKGKTLYRIIALISVSFDIVRGDRGGFVESEDNLSQEGECWIYDDAKVFGKAAVFGDAVVCQNAQVYKNAIISENAVISGNTKVYGHAKVSKTHKIRGTSRICGDSFLS